MSHISSSGYRLYHDPTHFLSKTFPAKLTKRVINDNTCEFEMLKKSINNVDSR